MICPHCGGSGKVDLEKATVGDMIVGRRKGLGLTQTELAQKIPLSRGQLANIEIGRSDLPILTLRKIADALGCPMRDLVP